MTMYMGGCGGGKKEGIGFEPIPCWNMLGWGLDDVEHVYGEGFGEIL